MLFIVYSWFWQNMNKINKMCRHLLQNSTQNNLFFLYLDLRRPSFLYVKCSSLNVTWLVWQRNWINKIKLSRQYDIEIFLCGIQCVENIQDRSILSFTLFSFELTQLIGNLNMKINVKLMFNYIPFLTETICDFFM